MLTINDRLARIEAVMREHRMHEGTCPVRQAQVHNARGQTYMLPKPCNCWLSEEES